MPMIRVVVFSTLLFAFLGAGCTPAPNCSVPEYVVTKFNDTNDGVCDAGDCSLREAVQNSNVCPGTQSIRLPAGEYELSIVGRNEDSALTGDLDILDDVIIIGDGAPSINANGIDRVFEIFAPTELRTLMVAGGSEQLGAGARNHSTLTVYGGNFRDNVASVPPGGSGLSSGGGLFNEAGIAYLYGAQFLENSADVGGGIHNFATAAIEAEDLVLAGNNAPGAGGGMWNNMAASAVVEGALVIVNTAGEAAGIYNAGSLEISGGEFRENVAAGNGGALLNVAGGASYLYNSRITNNSADLGGGIYNLGLQHVYESEISINTAFGGFGGGAYNDGAFPGLLLHNVTVSGNMVVPPGTAGGAGVYNHGADLLIEFSTFAYNSPDGILNDTGGNVNMESTILAYHAGGNCGGVSGPSVGYNLEDMNTCDLIEPSDLPMTNPLLLPLAMNGATTQTHALDPGSPAVDSGTPDMCTSNDQRYIPRPGGMRCDRGAFELETVALIPTPISPAPLTGSVSGALCYPSEGIPPLTLYFADTTSTQVYDFDHPDGTAFFSIDLAPSTYVAYAYATGTSIGGSYSQAVLCGLTVNCTDHTLIPFQVLAGETTTDIDICDYYGDPGDIPEAPGGFSMPAVTPIPDIPEFLFLQNANCRTGPGTAYPIVTSLLAEQIVLIDGRSEVGLPLWWHIALQTGGFCWVSDSTGEASGPLEDVHYLYTPPTPTPSIAPPAAPARFRIANWTCDAAKSIYRVTLDWIDMATNEEGYRIYRDGQLIATLAAGATTYLDQPPLGGPYTYAIEAFNAGGVSVRETAQDQGCQ
ncbi:MAG: CSLREA domain-containing protein [Anaerolineales bacterium]|nr:CSLREA domain-containing protein [Anaerolineales bacterium]